MREHNIANSQKLTLAGLSELVPVNAIVSAQTLGVSMDNASSSGRFPRVQPTVPDADPAPLRYFGAAVVDFWESLGSAVHLCVDMQNLSAQGGP